LHFSTITPTPERINVRVGRFHLEHRETPMKHRVTALLLLAYLSSILTACTNADTTVADIVALARSRCHYVTDYKAVEAILAASADSSGGTGVVTSVVAIANAICDAVTEKSSSGISTPKQGLSQLSRQCPAAVNGICVTGHFE
jgi:hypothetical protein